MLKDIYAKIKALLINESPRLIDELKEIVEKTETEAKKVEEKITPAIEKAAEEIKAEVKKVRKKK
jgi:DNA-binding transcriptional regulator GbsR (MarR family)